MIRLNNTPLKRINNNIDSGKKHWSHLECPIMEMEHPKETETKVLRKLS